MQYLYVFNFPSNEGVATWWSRLPGGVDSRFRVAAVQRYGVGAYPLVEWTVGRQFEHLKPYLQLTNLTNTTYQEIAGVADAGTGIHCGDGSALEGEVSTITKSGGEHFFGCAGSVAALEGLVRVVNQGTLQKSIWDGETVCILGR